MTFGLKRIMKIIFGMLEAGKLHQLTAEMKNYKLGILGVGDVRCNQF
jgi:hypothetical protein